MLHYAFRDPPFVQPIPAVARRGVETHRNPPPQSLSQVTVLTLTGVNHLQLFRNEQKHKMSTPIDEHL